MLKNKTLKLFKVQGIDHGLERATYRVVLLNSNGEDENQDINWVDLNKEEEGLNIFKRILFQLSYTIIKIDLNYQKDKIIKII